MTPLKKNAGCLVFACSGAADVGELADRAARQLHATGVAAMSCVAGIGGRDPDMMFNTDVAKQVLLIDGCAKACCRRTFEQAGLHRFIQFDLGQIGLKKGYSPVTQERVRQVVTQATGALRVATAHDTGSPSSPSNYSEQARIDSSKSVH